MYARSHQQHLRKNATSDLETTPLQIFYHILTVKNAGQLFCDSGHSQ